MKHEDLKNVDLEDISVTFYASPEKPCMPSSKATRGVLPLKLLCNKAIITQYSKDRDMMFLKEAHSSPDVPELY